MRYSTEDAHFSIKEIDMGMAADVGTLQRLPRIIGDGMMREMAYTGRAVLGAAAAHELSTGCAELHTWPDYEQLLAGVLELAQEIASKSPLAIRGTKEMIRFSRDHSVEEGLNYIATWNAAMLQSDDLKNAVMAHMSKQKPEFAD